MTSMGYKDLAQWIWSDKIANQFSAVLKTGEELENEYSYATCAIDFYLTVKSPYGNGVNPDLYLWIHTIGVSMQEQRSINARVVGNPDRSAAFANAMVVAFVMQPTMANILIMRDNIWRRSLFFSGRPQGFQDDVKRELSQFFSQFGTVVNINIFTPHLAKQFGGLTEEMMDDEEEIAEDEDNALPIGRDPNVWLGFIKQQGNNVPLAIQISLAKIWILNNQARVGSIGRLLHDKAVQILP